MTYSTVFSSWTAYRDFALKSLVLSLLVLSAFISGVGEAKAVTFDLTVHGVNDYWSDAIDGDGSAWDLYDGDEIDKNDNGRIETNYDYTVAFFAVNTNKTTYTVGETIHLSATVFGEVCENWNPRATVSATLNAQSTEIVSGALAGFQESFIYGISTLTAPMVPGTYTILADACYVNNSVGLSGCVQESITITVVSGAPVPPVAGAPVGVLGTANCWVLSGWTCDPSDFNEQLLVEFYDENSNYLGETWADIDNDESAVATQCGGTDWHRFETWLPMDELTDGVTRTVTAYAIGTGAGPSEQQLDGTFTLTCNPSDIAASMQTPAEGGVYKAGNPITFNVTAENTLSYDIEQAGWAGIDIDIDSDADRDPEPWYDDYDRYGAIPNHTTQLGAFAPSETKQFSYSTTSLPVGDHQVRFEVDVTDVLDETDGWNNYSWNPVIADTTWRTIHVISGDLTITPPSVLPGNVASVSWTTVNTEDMDCTVETGTGAVIGIGTSGTVSTGVVSEDVTYVLSCESIPLDVPVVLDVIGAVEPVLSTNTLIVEEGDDTSLDWDTNGVDETLCTLTGGALATNPLLTDGGDTDTGSKTVQVNARTTYTLTCPSGADTLTVEIVPKGFES